MKFKKVYVELTTTCGLKCSFCPPSERKREVMKPKFFEKINSQLKYYTDELYYHIIGDPLVLSNLKEYLDISLSHGLGVNITTSGFFMDREKFELLVHPAIKQVNFSLNSFNANESSMKLDEYLMPLFEFCSFKQSSSNNIFVNLRLWNLDIKQSSYGFNKAVFESASKYFGVELNPDEIYETKPKSIRAGNKVLFNFDEYFQWPSLQNPNFGEKGFCHGLGSHFGIHANGTVVPCCLDKDGVIALGNLHDSTLDEILSSQRAGNIIDGFKKGLAVEELCQKCSFKERFGK